MDGSNAKTIGHSVETVTYCLFHILFRDIYNNDHHCQVVASSQTEALNKIDYFLSKKKAERGTVTVMDEDTFKQNYGLARPYYIVFQNGTRRFCCILATNSMEAANEFRKRFSGIYGFIVLEDNYFYQLLASGKWKEIPLPII